MGTIREEEHFLEGKASRKTEHLWWLPIEHKELSTRLSPPGPLRQKKLRSPKARGSSTVRWLGSDRPSEGSPHPHLPCAPVLRLPPPQFCECPEEAPQLCLKETRVTTQDTGLLLSIPQCLCLSLSGIKVVSKVAQQGSASSHGVETHSRSAFLSRDPLIPPRVAVTPSNPK